MPITKISPPAAALTNAARRQIITAGALAVVGMASRSSPASADPNAEILSNEEAIHQERMLKAGRQRVYEALTVEDQFDKVVQLSGVMKTDVMASMRKPTKLSPHEGGFFALFGSYLVGRQIELVPNELIVRGS